MDAMKNFVMWFLSELPDFFLSEPIVYLFGFVLLAFTVKIILRLCRL